MNRRRLVVALVSLGVVAGAAVIVNHRIHALPDDAVLRYGDTVVTTQDLDRRVAVLKAVYGVEPPAGGSVRETFDRDAAKSYAVALVVEDVAKAKGIKVTNQAASRELSNMIEQKLGGDDDAFVDFLAQAGVNRADVQDEVRRTIAARRLFAQVTAGVAEATAAEAQRVYTSQRVRFKSPEQRTLRTIVVPSKSEASRIREELDGGADFAALAEKSSRDSVSAADGGRLGTVPKSALEAGFGTAAFTAEMGADFGPVRSRHGWNVGRVDDVVPPRQVDFDEVKGALIRQLTEDRRAVVWSPWLSRQLRQADVDYADAYRPRDPYAADPDLARR